ncbi:MAG: hypothetical protein HYV53_03500 [Parcubacteria group bacterium]|nr:hypothetical protein [Parcubacteria group bacterium]
MKKIIGLFKSIFQLQELAIKYPRLTVCLFAAATVFMLYGNYLTPEKTVVPKGAVMNHNNPVRQMDDRVAEKKKEGFRPDEPMVVTQKFSQGIKSIQDLKAILDLNNFIKQEFGRLGLDSNRLASPATMPRFVDQGNELTGDYYVNPAMFNDPEFKVEAWKKWVKEDPSVYGIFISRDFKTAFFRFYVEDDAEEKKVVWKMKSALEQKNFGWIDRFIEIDIRPKDKNLGVLGWIIGRWVIGQVSIINILTITTGAALLTITGFHRALGSWSQAVVSLIMFFSAIIWTRGAVGFLALAGSSVGESPYLLFSYAICILQGVSFSLQKFTAYNRLIKQGFSPAEAWQRTRGIRGINPLISLLAGISIGSFVSLWNSFGVEPIADMAIASSIGLSTLWVFSFYLLPALHMWLETKKEMFQKMGEKLRFLKPILWLLIKIEQGFGYIFVEIPLKGILRINIFLLADKNIAASATAVVCLLVGLTGWAFYEIVWPNRNLLSLSHPLDFIPDSLPEKTSQELNQEGQIGFEGLNFLLEPKWRQSEGIYDPRFLSMASKIKAGVANFPKEIGAREISTVVDGVARIARQSLHKPLPETEQEAGFIFEQIQNKLKPVMQGIMFFHNGLRLTVTCAADNSNDMARLRDAVIGYARKNFPTIRINAFGRANAYPEMDQEIRQGKPSNIGQDELLGLFIFLAWLLIAKRKKDKNLPVVRPWRGAVVMNIPMWFATVVLALIMVYGQIPLDLANAVISAFSINATSDFSFHLLKAFLEALSDGKNRRQAIAEVIRHDSRTIVEDWFLNNRIFFPLYLFCLSFIPIQRIGIMMLLMLTLCLIGILILVPPLLVLAVKERSQKISLKTKYSPAWERGAK